MAVRDNKKTTWYQNVNTEARSGEIVERIKRKRSLDDKTENKREKVEENSASESAESVFEEEITDMAGSSSSSTSVTGKIRDEVKAAIADPSYLKLLSDAFARQITQDLKNEIIEIRVSGEKTDKRVDNLEAQMDEYEQEKEAKM
jgi:hypothetical protein